MLDPETEALIQRDCPTDDRERARQALMAITREHVMAQSDEALSRTRMAVLQLSGGDIEKIEHYAKCAVRDFRDVIYWASQQKPLSRAGSEKAEQ